MKTIIVFLALLIISIGASAYTHHVGYKKGFAASEDKWKIEISEKNEKIAKLNAAAAEKTTEVVTKYVDKVRIIKQKGDEIVKEVPIYITDNDNANCKLPDAVRLLHNSAVAGEKIVPEATRTLDDGTKETKEVGK